MLRRHARWQGSGGPEQAGVAASLPGIGAWTRSVAVYSADHPGVPAGNRSLCNPVRRYATQAPHSRLRSGRALAQIGSRRRHRHHSGHHRPVRTGTGTRPASVRCLQSCCGAGKPDLCHQRTLLTVGSRRGQSVLCRSRRCGYACRHDFPWRSLHRLGKGEFGPWIQWQTLEFAVRRPLSVDGDPSTCQAVRHRGRAARESITAAPTATAGPVHGGITGMFLHSPLRSTHEDKRVAR